jgi:hypothetical protein
MYLHPKYIPIIYENKTEIIKIHPSIFNTEPAMLSISNLKTESTMVNINNKICNKIAVQNKDIDDDLLFMSALYFSFMSWIQVVSATFAGLRKE